MAYLHLLLIIASGLVNVLIGWSIVKYWQLRDEPDERENKSVRRFENVWITVGLFTIGCSVIAASLAGLYFPLVIISLLFTLFLKKEKGTDNDVFLKLYLNYWPIHEAAVIISAILEASAKFILPSVF